MYIYGLYISELKRLETQNTNTYAHNTPFGHMPPKQAAPTNSIQIIYIIFIDYNQKYGVSSIMALSKVLFFFGALSHGMI